MEKYSLTPKTGTGEGPSLPHHYCCSSEGFWTLFPPGILPCHHLSLIPVLPSCLLLNFLLSQHQQATRAPARREELALQGLGHPRTWPGATSIPECLPEGVRCHCCPPPQQLFSLPAPFIWPCHTLTFSSTTETIVPAAR